MSPAPRHGTPAGDVFLAIQKLARSSEGDVQELLTLYALEGVLARLAASACRDDLVLKGGVLLAAFDLRRPTKDIDLQATGLPNDVSIVRETVRRIVCVDIDDGLVFDPAEVTAQVTREDDEYAGVRVRLVGQLGKSHLTVGIDVNFGDPICPPATEIIVPRLIDLGQKPVRLLAYPLSMVVAEKTVTALERGVANTRWRDFADLVTINRSQVISAVELRQALATVAAYRKVDLVPLADVLKTMPELAQGKWATWRRRQAHADRLPERFADLLAEVADFLDPLLMSPLVPESQWDPGSRVWEMR